MYIEPDIVSFSYKGNLILLFFTKSKFLGHESSLLVLRTCCRGGETI